MRIFPSGLVRKTVWKKCNYFLTLVTYLNKLIYDSGYYNRLQVVEEERKQESRSIPLENWRYTGTVKHVYINERNWARDLKSAKTNLVYMALGLYMAVYMAMGHKWYSVVQKYNNYFVWIYIYLYFQFKVHEITRGLCSCPEQCLCALWCSTEAFWGTCTYEGCGDSWKSLYGAEHQNWMFKSLQ